MKSRIKIVDFSTLIPGPFSAYLLGKYLQAEIIKIEDQHQPDALVNLRPTEEGIGLGYTGINQGKQIIRIDLRKDGTDRIKQEIKDADIFLENFKPGRTYKIGLSFEDLIAINPKLIYCSLVGYPQNHPLSRKSAHDLNILALSGYLDQQMKLGESWQLPPLLLADTFTSYHAVLNILSCLYNKSEGIHLNISMLEAFLEAMHFNNFPQLKSQKDFSANDYILSGKYPCYSLYKSKDGGVVAVAALEKPLWIDFCHHIGHVEWIEHQFDVKIIREVSQVLNNYDRSHWLNADTDFCVSPVLSINESRRNKYV